MVYQYKSFFSLVSQSNNITSCLTCLQPTGCLWYITWWKGGENQEKERCKCSALSRKIVHQRYFLVELWVPGRLNNSCPLIQLYFCIALNGRQCHNLHQDVCNAALRYLKNNSGATVVRKNLERNPTSSGWDSDTLYRNNVGWYLLPH